MQSLINLHNKNILLSELYNARKYIDRLTNALFDMGLLGQNLRLKKLMSQFYCAIHEHLDNYQFADQLLANPGRSFDVYITRNKISQCHNLIEALSEIGLNKKSGGGFVIDYINVLYTFGHQLHLLVEELTDYEVALPSSIHLELGEEEDTEDDNFIPRFQLVFEDLLNQKDPEVPTNIFLLNRKREIKHHHFIKTGQELIQAGKTDAGLEQFFKALNYKESAEINNLIGWAYSLLGEYEKAKSYCLKAIQNDPDHGPSYNDMGSYLLTQGHSEESLKWFQLAKNAIHNQNREYPYINAGRAYLSQKNYKKALEEFGHALTLAPNHEELHQTVKRLKMTLEKRTVPGEDDSLDAKKYDPINYN